MTGEQCVALTRKTDSTAADGAEEAVISVLARALDVRESLEG